LTEDEWRQVRRHPLAGAELIAEHPLLSRALPVVRYHHERWDGDGYPQGLAGEAIPLGARIFSVCDTLDILTTTRPYRAQMTYPAAREEIARGSGTQFDPDVVAAFLRIPEEEWLRLTTPHSSALSEPMLMPYSRAA
jgi:ribonuclease P protein subunit RPR2